MPVSMFGFSCLPFLFHCLLEMIKVLLFFLYANQSCLRLYSHSIHEYMLQDPFSFPCYVFVQAFEKAIAKLDLHFGRRIVQGKLFGLQMSRLVPLSNSCKSTILLPELAMVSLYHYKT